MRILERGVVAASTPMTDARSHTFPSIAVLGDGRWVASFRCGPTKSSRSEWSMICWSDDEGRTWSRPRELRPTIKHEGRRGTWRTVAVTSMGGRRVLASLCWVDCTQPRDPMYNEATEGLVDMKLYTAVSRDGGESFGSPREIVAGKYRNVPTPATGPTIVLADGTWVAQFEVNKHFNDKRPWRHSSAIVRSTDQGRTWGPAIDIHSDPSRRVFCWDQRISLLGDGSLLDVFWTFDRKAEKYLNMHARQSSTGGKTWGKLWDIGVPGQPARPVELLDGRLLLVYVDRTSVPTIKARLSEDRGRTWPSSSEIDIRKPDLAPQAGRKASMQEAWAEMAKFSLGLPDATLLPDGDVIVVYYNGPETDCTSIEWARLRVPSS